MTIFIAFLRLVFTTVQLNLEQCNGRTFKINSLYFYVNMTFLLVHCISIVLKYLKKMVDSKISFDACKSKFDFEMKRQKYWTI